MGGFEMKTHEIVEELVALDKTSPTYSQDRMRLMVQYLKRYMETYDSQHGYENYTDTTLINDMLYGLGVAINPEKHQFANGFDLWKKELKSFIEKY